MIESGGGKYFVQGMIIPFGLIIGVFSPLSFSSPHNLPRLKSQIYFWWEYAEVNVCVCLHAVHLLLKTLSINYRQTP